MLLFAHHNASWRPGFAVGASANSGQLSFPTVFPPDVTDDQGCLVFVLRVDSGIRKVMVMQVFVAGGIGVVGLRPPRAMVEGATE